MESISHLKLIHPLSKANLHESLLRHAKATYLWCLGDLLSDIQMETGVDEEYRETLEEEWHRVNRY